MYIHKYIDRDIGTYKYCNMYAHCIVLHCTVLYWKHALYYIKHIFNLKARLPSFSLSLFLTLSHFHSFVFQAIALMTRHQRQQTLPYKTSWNLFKFYNCYQTLSYCNACIVNRHTAVSTKIDLDLASRFLVFVTFLALHISEDVYFVFWILFFWILYKIGGQTDRHIYSQSNNQKDRHTDRHTDCQIHSHTEITWHISIMSAFYFSHFLFIDRISISQNVFQNLFQTIDFIYSPLPLKEIHSRRYEMVQDKRTKHNSEMRFLFSFDCFIKSYRFLKSQKWCKIRWWQSY